MDVKAFENLRERFRSADTETKIDLYLSAENLTQMQYRELLGMFPISELDKLEAALS